MTEFGSDREPFRFLAVFDSLKTGSHWQIKTVELDKLLTPKFYSLKEISVFNLHPKTRTELNVNLLFLICNSLYFKKKKQRIMYTHL